MKDRDILELDEQETGDTRTLPVREWQQLVIKGELYDLTVAMSHMQQRAIQLEQQLARLNKA